MTAASPVDRISRLLAGVSVAVLGAALSVSAWAEPPAADGTADAQRLRIENASRSPVTVKPAPYVSSGSVKVEDRERLLPLPHIDTLEDDAAPEQVDKNQGTTMEVGALADVDPGSFGLLNETNGGLPVDLWRGTSRLKITQLVAGLPTATRSPHVNRLVRLLLVSSFTIPMAEKRVDPGDYIRLRARKLADNGHLTDLVAFLDAMPDVANDVSLLKLQTEAALLSGDYSAACRLIERGRAMEGATYWVRLDTLCAALKGNEAATAFNMTLLDETGEVSAPFPTLIGDVLARAKGDKQPLKPLDVMPADFDVLSFALYSVSGRALPLSMVKKAAPLVISAAAMRGEITNQRRLELATAAARRGLFDTQDLVGLALSLKFSDAELASAPLLADDPADARTDALLLQAGLKARETYGKSSLLTLAWTRARTMGDEFILSPGYQKVAKAIAPARGMLFFAGDAARIALAAGDLEGAMGWYDLAMSAALQGDVEGTRILMGLWPFVLIGDEENATPYSPEVLELWRQGQAVLGEAEVRARAAYLYAILDVFDHPVPPAMWQDAGSLSLQRDESTVGGVSSSLFGDVPHRGELLARALHLLGSGGVRDLDSKKLIEALGLLRRAGFDDVARSLAIEALIGRGF